MFCENFVGIWSEVFYICSFLMVTSKREIRSSIVNIPQKLSNLQLLNSCCNNKQLNESSKKKSVGRRKVGVRFVATCRRWNSHYSPKGFPSPEPLTTSSPHPYDSIVDPWLLTLTSLRTPTFVTWSSIRHGYCTLTWGLRLWVFCLFLKYSF